MALGLFVTAGTAAFVGVSPSFQALVGQPLLFFVLMIAVIVLVIGLSWGINRLAPATAILLFILYIALNGVTFSVLFVAYTLDSVAHTFLVTAVLFGLMSIIGYITKMDLSKMGSFLFLFMGLIGLVIAMLVNIFWTNTTLGLIITFVGILLFLGPTVYDIQHTNPPVVQEPKWDLPQTRELAQRDVDDGRQRLNFSDWGHVRNTDDIPRVIHSGKMPMPIFLSMHPEARLTQAEKDALISGMQATISGQ